MKSQRSRQKWKRAILYTGGFMCQHNRNLNDLGELYRSSTTTGGKQDATTINLVTRFHFISKGIKGTFFFLILRLCPLFFFLSCCCLLELHIMPFFTKYQWRPEKRDATLDGSQPTRSIPDSYFWGRIKCCKAELYHYYDYYLRLCSLFYVLLLLSSSLLAGRKRKKKSISCRPIVVVTLELSFHLTLRCATLVKRKNDKSRSSNIDR